MAVVCRAKGLPKVERKSLGLGGPAHPTNLNLGCAPPWTYAYDFLMPIGSEIVAVRGGTVAFVREEFTDADKGLEQGYVVVIDHGDGTFAGYGHITHEGVLVEQGEQVAQGESLARSGNSGASTIPHLHFQVSPCLEAETCGSLPITFRNTRANPTGLALSQEYEALPLH
ncbi:M23 family metallopeptidase [Gemmatimonadota bacterium]